MFRHETCVQTLCKRELYSCAHSTSSGHLHRSDRGHVTYLLLPQLYGQFETVEVHPLPVLEGRSCGVMIQEYFQLVGAPSVVQQRCREVLTLLPEFLHRCDGKLCWPS